MRQIGYMHLAPNPGNHINAAKPVLVQTKSLPQQALDPITRHGGGYDLLGHYQAQSCLTKTIRRRQDIEATLGMQAFETKNG